MASSHPDCKACGDCKCPKYLDLALWGIMAEKCRWDNPNFRADIAYDRSKTKSLKTAWKMLAGSLGE